MKIQFLFSAFVAIANITTAQGLQPDDSNALVNVSVINYQKKAMPGEEIIFTSKTNGKSYSGTTDSTGKFQLLMPKNADYKVKYVEFSNETAYNNILSIPEGKDQLLTFNYIVRVELPETYTLHNVFFDFNKATLDRKSDTELNKLAKFLKAQNTMVIEVAGYTDNVGTDAENLKLSQQRADAIRNYLIEKGVKPKTMVAKGYGSSSPVASNDTPEGRQQNRRTEIHILQK